MMSDNPKIKTAQYPGNGIAIDLIGYSNDEIRISAQCDGGFLVDEMRISIRDFIAQLNIPPDDLMEILQSIARDRITSIDSVKKAMAAAEKLVQVETAGDPTEQDMKSLVDAIEKAWLDPGWQSIDD